MNGTWKVKSHLISDLCVWHASPDPSNQETSGKAELTPHQGSICGRNIAQRSLVSLKVYPQWESLPKQNRKPRVHKRKYRRIL